MEPRKLDIGIWYDGRSHPVWVYDSIPDGMRQVKRIQELRPGQDYLSKCLLGPDKGLYYTGIVRPTIMEELQTRLFRGIPIYVK